MVIGGCGEMTGSVDSGAQQAEREWSWPTSLSGRHLLVSW